MSDLVHHLVASAAQARADAPALVHRTETVSYAALADGVELVAHGLTDAHLQRRDRVAVYLDKRPETVQALFGAAAAGCVFVPINPLLKARQVAHILRDCAVRLLVTSKDRLAGLAEDLADCSDLRYVVLVDSIGAADDLALPALAVEHWDSLLERGRARTRPLHRTIDVDMAAILYTSGSTGLPKGVVLSHRNIVAGAKSVSSYLENCADDRILSVLPLSFDAGFSQLTTAFHTGATVVLLNYLLPRDVVRVCSQERITGITAVPPLWIQLSQLDWPEDASSAVRYFANTGGHMPRSTLDALRARLPRAKPYLMYGLTEAFRSTYLDPAEVDRRPESIGKAIPNAEILVVREDGELCQPGEHGELVHRGALVAMGYWNDPERTAGRFRPAPGQPSGLPIPELAVWSGDTVRLDDDGFLYFVGRTDEMIKTSGYRVSPTEIEDLIYATGLVGEAAALGVAHSGLGQAIVVVATPPPGGALDVDGLMQMCRQQLPLYMVPALIAERSALPRNPNGKIDRKTLGGDFVDAFADGP